MQIKDSRKNFDKDDFVFFGSATYQALLRGLPKADKINIDNIMKELGLAVKEEEL